MKCMSLLLLLRIFYVSCFEFSLETSPPPHLTLLRLKVFFGLKLLNVFIHFFSWIFFFSCSKVFFVFDSRFFTFNLERETIKQAPIVVIMQKVVVVFFFFLRLRNR